MKRFLYGLLLALTLTLGYAHVTTAASLNDFTISSFDADYQLSKDGDGRSTLKIVEKITAVFPQTNQNHGLERAIPTKYDGHTTDLSIVSVTNESGVDIDYSTSTSNDNKVLRIGNANTYVHGENTYIITYAQRDVTRHFADTNKDEFYWDTNGTEWAVPIESFNGTIHIDESIASTLTKDMACYQGANASTERCDLSRDGNTITTSAYNLAAGENLTVALGFETGTFAAYKMTPLETVLAWALLIWTRTILITSGIAIACMVWLGRRYGRQTNRSKEIGTVIPEYLPPKGYSTIISAQVAGGTASTLSAALIDLGVRHYLKVYQTREKSLMQPAQYELELVRIDDSLAKEELALLEALFPGLTIGSRFAIKSLNRNYKLGKVLDDIIQKTAAKDALGIYGIREKNTPQISWFKRAGLIMLLVGIFTFSPLLLFAGILSYTYAALYARLTDKGLDLQRYLAGLKLYISVAEVDRLKMLQSPEGAQKVGVSVNGGDDIQLVKLYERVLPYAMLFGLEKQWNAQLGAHYETTGGEPDWYSGTGAFNAIAFGAAMSSFTSSATTYQAASGSSSGGSSGGGSSGGGGGGGGGGGW